MIGKTSYDMPHVDHIIWNINASNNQRNYVIDLRLKMFRTTFPQLIIAPIFFGCNQPELCGNSEITDCEEQSMVYNFT